MKKLRRLVNSSMTLLAVALYALTVIAACSVQGSEQPSSSVSVPTLSQDELQRAKLNAEIESLQAATAQQTSTTAAWLRWAPFLTVLVAAGTLGAALVKQASDSKASRQKDQDEKERERKRKEEETLSNTVQNLGSENSRLRLNAAAALVPALRLRGEDTSAQDLLAVLVANLRIEEDQDVLDVLVDDLEMTLARLADTGHLPPYLDLSRALIRRLRLPPGMDLGRVDLAFGTCRDSQLADCTLKRLRGFQTDFSKTRFTGANLHEARLNQAICRGTDFHQAQLVSATFKGACLIGSEFQQAHLQGAHLESADCFGASFKEADVADAWFCNGRGDAPAKFDESALMSLRYAKRLDKAHFAPAQAAWLMAHPR